MLEFENTICIDRPVGEVFAFLSDFENMKRLEDAGSVWAQAHLGEGVPSAEIVALGEEIDAGLIVVGSRGLGGVRRALTGSVSEAVTRHAHCPVLVVRKETAPDVTV